MLFACYRQPGTIRLYHLTFYRSHLKGSWRVNERAYAYHDNKENVSADLYIQFSSCLSARRLFIPPHLFPQLKEISIAAILKFVECVQNVKDYLYNLHNKRKKSRFMMNRLFSFSYIFFKIIFLALATLNLTAIFVHPSAFAICSYVSSWK